MIQQYLDALGALVSYPTRLHQMSKPCIALAVSKLSWEGMVNKFLTLLDEAHLLRAGQPRYPTSLRLGKELASQALECKRLGETADWLDAQWRSSRKQLSQQENHLVELQKSKDWLESHLKAIEAARDVQVAWLESQLIAHQSQMREESARLARLQSALPVRVLRRIGAISDA